MDRSGLDFPVTEHLVLFRTAAMCTFEAANEEYCYADSDQHGEHAPVHCKPMG